MRYELSATSYELSPIHPFTEQSMRYELSAMNHLTLEQQLTLLLSRLDCPRDVAEVTLTNSLQEVDFTKLIDVAVSHGVASLVYRNLKDIRGMPADVLDQLRNTYLFTAASNIAVSTEIVRVVRHLRDRGIDIIPLRGPVAAELTFGDPGLYPPGDIDILVKPTDLNALACALDEIGYVHNEQRARDLLISHYHLVFSNGRHHIEAHWNLVKRYFSIPPDFWWNETRKQQFNGIDILTLSPEKHLLSLIFRLFSHQFGPLKFFALASETINSQVPSVDWDKLLSFAAEYRMRRLLIFTLKLLNELLGTAVPTDLVVANLRGYDLLKRAVVTGLFRTPQRPHTSKIWLCLLLDSPLDWLTIMFRRFCPAPAELRLRYGIPVGSKKLYFYYVLNPLLLPVMLLKEK